VATVFRIKIRSGKDELRKYDALNFPKWRKCVGDIVTDTMRAIRYVTPTADGNRARWPVAPFWREVMDIARSDLAVHMCGARRGDILLAPFRERKLRLQRQIIGTVASYAALLDHDVSEVPAVVDEVGELILNSARDPNGQWRRSHKHATSRSKKI